MMPTEEWSSRVDREKLAFYLTAHLETDDNDCRLFRPAPAPPPVALTNASLGSDVKRFQQTFKAATFAQSNDKDA